MANYPGSLVYPLCYGNYNMMDAGPKGSPPPPPPINYPGAYTDKWFSQQLFGIVDAGQRIPHGPLGMARGSPTFPHNANIRGVFKRYDPKQKLI